MADLLVRSISRELDLKETIRLDPLARGSAGLVEAIVPEDGHADTVGDVNTPHGRVLLIVRDNSIVIPGEGTELVPGDHVLMVCHAEHEDQMIGRIAGEDNPPAVPSPNLLVVEDHA